MRQDFHTLFCFIFKRRTDYCVVFTRNQMEANGPKRGGTLLNFSIKKHLFLLLSIAQRFSMVCTNWYDPDERQLNEWRGTVRCIKKMYYSFQTYSRFCPYTFLSMIVKTHVHIPLRTACCCRKRPFPEFQHSGHRPTSPCWCEGHPGSPRGQCSPSAGAQFTGFTACFELTTYIPCI